MNSTEKPYEHISSSEKKIFDICGEIIAYKRDMGDIDLLRLRERATNLFAKMREVDLSEHDFYFKLIAEADSLRSDFEKIKNKTVEDIYINIPWDTNGAEDIADKLIDKLKSSSHVNTWFEWYPPDQDWDPHGDMTGVYVHKETPEKYGLLFVETINHERFTSDSHIRVFKDTHSLNDAEFSEHEHDGLETTELSLAMNNLALDETRELILSFVEIMKVNPRSRNE